MGREEIRDNGLKHMQKLANLFANKKVVTWMAQFMADTSNCDLTTDEAKTKKQIDVASTAAIITTTILLKIIAITPPAAAEITVETIF